jgi:hypothetical protein
MALTTTMARVKQRVDALRLSSKLPARTIASLADLSAMKFSNAILGNTYLGSEVEAKLSDLTLQFQELEDSVRPLSIPTDELQLRALLDHMGDHNISTNDVRGAIQNFFGVAQE